MTHYLQSPNFRQEKKSKVAEKKWGSEELIINEDYCVKVMRLKPGYQCSLHWHAEKKETFILVSGGLTIETVDQKAEIIKVNLTEVYSSFTLETNVPHTFYCPEGQVEETVFIEASTKDRASDSYRVFPSRKR